MANTKNRLKNLFWVFFERFGLVGLSILSFLLYAKFLTPEQMGIGILLLALVEFISSLFIATIDNSMIRLKKITTKQDGASFWALMSVSLVISAIIYCGYLLYFDDSKTRTIGFLAVCSLPLLLVARIHIIHLRKQKKFKQLANATIIGKLCGMSVGISLAVLGFGEFSIVTQTLIMSLISAIIIFNVEKRSLPFNIDKNFTLEQLRVGLPSSVKVMSGSILMKGLVIVIESTMGTAAVGIYNFATRLIELPRGAILSALMGYANPVYSNRNNLGKPLDTFFIGSTKFALLVIMPCFVGLSVMADPLVKLIFAEKWTPSIIVLQGVALISAFSLFFMFLPGCLIAFRKTKLGLKGTIFANLSGLAVAILLIAEYEFIAVIIGLGVRTLITLLVYIIVLLKIFPDSFTKFVKACALPTVGCLVMVLSIVSLRYFVSFESMLLALLVEITLGIFVYIITILGINRRITNELRMFIKSDA